MAQEPRIWHLPNAIVILGMVGLFAGIYLGAAIDKSNSMVERAGAGLFGLVLATAFLGMAIVFLQAFGAMLAVIGLLIWIAKKVG